MVWLVLLLTTAVLRGIEVGLSLVVSESIPEATGRLFDFALAGMGTTVGRDWMRRGSSRGLARSVGRELEATARSKSPEVKRSV